MNPDNDFGLLMLFGEISIIDNRKNILNEWIESNYCKEIDISLNDSNLLTVYKTLPSVAERVEILRQILKTNNICNDIIGNVINEYMIYIIPAGAKAAIRGNQFNKIIQQKILNMKLNTNLYDIQFEKHCHHANTNECPDWFILERSTNKVLIGMNQIDLWGGGSQFNRAFKYLNNDFHSSDKKMICVICKHTYIKCANTKLFKIFDIGYENENLCYPTNLYSIITRFFGI